MRASRSVCHRGRLKPFEVKREERAVSETLAQQNGGRNTGAPPQTQADDGQDYVWRAEDG